MFKNRTDAGIKLFEKNKDEFESFNSEEIVVLGLNKGGIEIAKILSEKLNSGFDVIFVEKLKSENEKIEIGGVGQTRGSLVLNAKIVKELNVKEGFIQKQVLEKMKKIEKKEKAYRKKKLEVGLQNKNVIICSDGVITGIEMITACREVWNKEPKKVIAVSPVFSLEGYKKVEKEVDSVIKLIVDKELFGASQYYESF